MTFSIHTMGCKVNIYESEYVCSLLTGEGYKKVSFGLPCDVCIINTCSVTNEADKKAIKYIKRARRDNPKATLIVMGCHSQTGNIPECADIVIGNKDKSKIIKLIKEYQQNHQKILAVSSLASSKFEDMTIKHFEDYTRAFVKIQDGCNAFCSYCIIPYARGPIRSKEFDSIMSEVSTLVDNGYKEIVLTGIHTGKYGLDIGLSLEQLLKSLVQIPNLYRLRLSSIEINEVTDGIIDLIKNNKIMARHLHIPLQSGSDEILKKMNRKYDCKYFIDRINYIREKIPNISITTDLIVGFPGEDDSKFNQTLSTLNKLKFTKIHTFPYSRRKGTPADKMDHQVDENIKRVRVKKVIELSNSFEEEFYQKYLNQNLEIVTEKRKGQTIGYTSNYIPVIIQNQNVSNNEIISIKITKVCGLDVYGVVNL